jgi:1,4-dihydroxy-2-naphthoate octaprenyltransferase
MAILVVNNLRDVDTDRNAGKRTLAVRFGKGFARAEYAGCLVAAGLVPPALLLARFVAGAPSGPLVLLPLLALPLAIPLARTVMAGGDPRRLNLALRGTARLGLLFGGLFAAGLAAGAWPA